MFFVVYVEVALKQQVQTHSGNTSDHPSKSEVFFHAKREMGEMGQSLESFHFQSIFEYSRRWLKDHIQK